jgi:hypothetical protein
MPKIRRRNVPRGQLLHLLDRVEERGISKENLIELRSWLLTNPEVPEDDWFKRFAEFTVVGRGELIKTFLIQGQRPYGTEIT